MQSQTGQTQVGIIMGSRSEWSTLKHTAKLLGKLGITYEARVVTANRNLNQLHNYASNAVDRGLEIIIAGSGNTAQLPRTLASRTDLPVLGVPVRKTKTSDKKTANTKVANNCSTTLTKQGNIITHKQYSSINAGQHLDVITTDSDGAVNAALIAANMLSSKYPKIQEALEIYRHGQHSKKRSEEQNLPFSRHVA